ncbi:hypothetical protein DWA27_17235 [Acinetobacter baumannii]|uniref:hypothetical protein n=1 Tax=Acinetobacter baumannii TaxID=470 RepID=UPI000B53A1A6|nr:hypothetical protein [Acinetobacter baumannii]OWW99595.1 hypothetical protein A7A66_02720 [Acinetobacter baumannii]OWX01220.1 hypothetical protein A7A67_18055 [Acinetobacter baumannii]OWX09746.1 hypothetical protein A7A35_07050 [Acinetobacter baumannii]OWX37891.1 hypothetical protein A7A42_08745 [Acinetobacter baumannii]RSF83567.1 hypothetical protein EGU15_11555 [Acinetobacter baumannii]
MTQLINKGGFRERANRSQKYQRSENKQVALPSNKYQPQTKLQDNQNEMIQAKAVISETSDD